MAFFLLIWVCGHAENGEFSTGKMTGVWHQQEENKLRIISLKKMDSNRVILMYFENNENRWYKFGSVVHIVSTCQNHFIRPFRHSLA